MTASKKAPGRRGVGSHLAFLIVPLLLLAIAALLSDSEGPYWGSQNFDPDYNYLLNSLNILLLRAPAHIDHPGTTVQLLGAIATLARWLLARLEGGDERLQESVLLAPESYLQAIHGALVMLLVATIYLAGRRTAVVARSHLAGLTLQGSALLFVAPLLALPRVAPEPVLITSVFALLIALLPSAFGAGGARRHTGGWTGAVFGFGLVSKVTFLPLAALISLLPGWNRRGKAILAATLTASALLIPVWRHLPHMARWLWSLLTHTDVYGGGPAGFVSWSRLRWSLGQIVTDEPMLLPWAVFYVTAFLALRRGLAVPPDDACRSAARVLGACVLALSLQLAMTAKHFQSTRYLIPALVATALPNAVLLPILRSNRLRTFPRRALSASAVALVATSLAYSARGVEEARMHSLAARAEEFAIAGAIRSLGNCTLVGYYRSAAPGFALAFASEYSEFVHAALLEKIHPGTIVFQRFAGEFVGFARNGRNREVFDLLAGEQCVLLQGSPSTAAEILLPADLEMAEIVHGQFQSLYRLRLKERSPHQGPAAPDADLRMR